MKYFVLHGAAGSARRSVAEDAYVKQRNRVVGVIDRLVNDGHIRAFPSPAVAGYRRMAQILSDHLESSCSTMLRTYAKDLAHFNVR
jgi:hypothetical protein